MNEVDRNYKWFKANLKELLKKFYTKSTYFLHYERKCADRSRSEYRVYQQFV